MTMKAKLFWSSFPLILLLLTACGSGGDHHDAAMAEHLAMMKADSAAKAQLTAQEATARAIIDLVNSKGTEGIENLMSEDFVDHQQDPSITTTGIQGAKDMFTLLHTAYPDFKQEVLAMSTTGDRTFIHLRMTGTNTGAWGAMPATGKTMDVLGVDILRFEDGKAVEHWGYMEEMKMMTQLGMMPAPGTEPGNK